MVRFSASFRAIVRDSEPRKTSLENPETRVERRAPSSDQSAGEASRAAHRCGRRAPRSGRTRSTVRGGENGRSRGVDSASTSFASGFLARYTAAPEANEATFAPCVETKNNPQRADADGLKSAMRALGDRRVKRPRPARSRTCTLDSLHVCLSHALDARSDALPRRLAPGARRSRAVRRAERRGRDGTRRRPPRFARRDVPCDATCRASHDDAHNAPSWFRPSRPPELTSRGRCPARRAVGRCARRVVAAKTTFRSGARRTFARIVGRDWTVVWGSMRKRYLIGYLIGQRIRSKDREDLRRKGKSLTPQERCQTEPRNWREARFFGSSSLHEARCEEKSAGMSRTPHTARSRRPRVSPDRARLPGRGRDQPRRSARTHGVRRARSEPPAARRAATSPPLPLGPRNRHLFALPVARAYARAGGMSLSVRVRDGRVRVRPTEKYWTDYEDWKVRPPIALEAPRHERSSRENEKACGVAAAVVLIISRPEVSWKNVFVLFLKDRLTAFRAPHAASHTSVCRHS